MRPQNVAGVAGTGALIMAAGALADRAVFHVRPPVSETRPEQVQLTPFVLTSAHLSHCALHWAIPRVYPWISMDRLSSY